MPPHDSGGAFSRGRKPGGPWAGSDFAERENDSPERAGRPETVPPEERKDAAQAGPIAPVVHTIVVRDEKGRIVSVTRVAPDARFGVGVKPPPGHTVAEFEAGTLAEDPFAAPRPSEPGPSNQQ